MWLLLGASALLAGCGGGDSLAPVQDRPGASVNARGEHIVRPGESLYLIAWRHGLDYTALARANRIRPPFRIVPGQRIALREAPAPAASKPVRTPRTQQRKAIPQPTPSPQPRAPLPKRPKTSGKPVLDSSQLYDNNMVFRWPTAGKITGAFGREGGKGVNIAGRAGQPVVAVAAGDIVYAGNGLLGYGNLIIIKHQQNYLSAYAHNQAVFVTEGDAVSAGQKIASLGSTGTDRPRLHFELRRQGKAVNPADHLRR